MTLAIAKELYREGEKIILGKIIPSQKEVFLRKVRFTLDINPEITKDEKLVNHINSIQAGTITNKKLRLSSPEEMNKTSLEIWLRKKMIERTINGKNFSEAIGLEKLKKERGFDHISDSKLKEKIINGEVILEKIPIRINSVELGANVNTKENENIQKIKSGFNTLKEIIYKDLREDHYFIVENMSYINPLIDNINKSFRILNKDSSKINKEFIVLKNELMKASILDEKEIKLSLFKISKIIETL